MYMYMYDDTGTNALFHFAFIGRDSGNCDVTNSAVGEQTRRLIQTIMDCFLSAVRLADAGPSDACRIPRNSSIGKTPSHKKQQVKTTGKIGEIVIE